MLHNSIYTFLANRGFNYEYIQEVLQESDSYYKPVEHIDRNLFNNICEYAEINNMELEQIWPLF